MSVALLDHLWQSTMFALGAWALTRLLRKNGAHLRYAVWLAASIKFLVPFSLLTMLGAQLQPHLGTASAQSFAIFAANDVTTKLAAPASAMFAPSAGFAWWSVAIILWSIGFLGFAARWFARWRSVSSIVRAAAPAPIAAQIPVRMSASLREPGVVGILRPVLLLPAHIESQLTRAQLDAILAHELSHARRHDNLTAAVHMLVETIFWFHPLVWWIGARLIDERERACDEAVVRAGSDRRVYAEGILRVCRSCVASDLPCVAGVSGADLKTRLEAIMKNNEVEMLGKGKRLALGVLTLGVVAAPVMIGLTSPALAAEHTVHAVDKIELLAGKRVRLQLENVDVRGLIRAMGQAANVNILVSDKVSGTVTVKLAEMPWEQAFDIILNSQGLVKHEKDGILFVEPAST